MTDDEKLAAWYSARMGYAWRVRADWLEYCDLSGLWQRSHCRALTGDLNATALIQDAMTDAERALYAAHLACLPYVGVFATAKQRARAACRALKLVETGDDES